MAVLTRIVYLVILTIAMLPFSSCGQSANKGDKLSAAFFNELLKATPTAQLVDVRTPAEYEEGHIPGSVNLNYNADNFQQSTQSLDKSKLVFVYCHSGRRSTKAASYMRGVGFSRVVELKDGIVDWQAQGLSTTTK